MRAWKRLSKKAGNKEVYVDISKAVIVEAIPGGGCTIRFSGQPEDKIEVNEALSAIVPEAAGS